jgi:hypothetical protein
MPRGRIGENMFGVEALKQGETLVFRPVGNSMKPRIENRALVTVTPLHPDDPVDVDDVVFCKVRGRVMLHLVTAIRRGPGGKAREVQISNNHGHVNGWTSRDQVFGRVVKVEP